MDNRKGSKCYGFNPLSAKEYHHTRTHGRTNYSIFLSILVVNTIDSMSLIMLEL